MVRRGLEREPNKRDFTRPDERKRKQRKIKQNQEKKKRKRRNNLILLFISGLSIQVLILFVIFATVLSLVMGGIVSSVLFKNLEMIQKPLKEGRCTCRFISTPTIQPETNVPGHSGIVVPKQDNDFSTGSLDDASIPEPSKKWKTAIDNMLPAAIVMSERLHIHIAMTLSVAPHEGGWDNINKPNGYHLFSVKGNGPRTGGKTAGGWSTHDSYEDAVLHYGYNYWSKMNDGESHPSGEFKGEGYEMVLRAYDIGVDEQIERHSRSGYNGYDGPGQNTRDPGSVRQYAIDYANKIRATAHEVMPFNNIEVAKAYLKKKGLYHKYEEAKKMADWYEQYYFQKKGKHYGYANVNDIIPKEKQLLLKYPDKWKHYQSLVWGQPAGKDAIVSTDSSAPLPITPQQGGFGETAGLTGRWVRDPRCRCGCNQGKKVSCCGCSNPGGIRPGENPDDPGIWDGSALGSFGNQQVGQASGLWGTTEQLLQYLNEMNESNKPVNCRNLVQLKKNLSDLPKYFGMKPVNMFQYSVDRYKGSDGYGFIRYDQGSYRTEPFNRLIVNDGLKHNFTNNGCGLYALSMVLSTLEKKWVSPAEVNVALQTIGVRIGRPHVSNLMSHQGSGATYKEALVHLLKEAGYDVGDYSKKVNKARLDRTLDAGGMMIYVAKYTAATVGITDGGGHYVVVRERTKDGKYLIGNSVGRDQKAYTFEQIAKSWKNTSIYVLPKTRAGQQNKFPVPNQQGQVPGGVYPNPQGLQPGAPSNPNTNTAPQSNYVAPHPPTDMSKIGSTSLLMRNGYNSGMYHGGIDMGTGGKTNVPAYAMWTGVVCHSQYNKSYGNLVIIRHDNGLYTLYGHLAKPGLSKGTRVSPGTQIGVLGNTGYSFGVHLHHEVIVSGSERSDGYVQYGTKQVVDTMEVLAGKNPWNLTRFQNHKNYTEKNGTFVQYGYIVQKGEDYNKYAPYINSGNPYLRFK